MTKTQTNRLNRLMPSGIPRYVRCYDNEGITADRFTVVFTGRRAWRGPAHMPGNRDARWKSWPYLAMSSNPTHPQGVGHHGEAEHQPADTHTGNPKKPYCWPPAIGRKCHLGKRITFAALPAPCQNLVRNDYRAIWGL